MKVNFASSDLQNLGQKRNVWFKYFYSSYVINICSEKTFSTIYYINCSWAGMLGNLFISALQESVCVYIHMAGGRECHEVDEIS